MSRFQPEVIKDLAWMSRIMGMAYANTWVPVPDLKLIKAYNNKWSGTQAYLLEDHRRRYMVFAGTEPEDIRDWWVIFAASPVQFLSFPGTYHQGFIRGLNSVREEVERDILNTNMYDPKPLVCLGHSMGGPLAELCHAHLRVLGLNTTSVTIGAPGYADVRARTWLRKFSGSMVRVQNAGDPVPYLAQIKGWHHVADPLFLDHRGKAHHHTSAWQRLRFLFLAWTGNEDRIWKRILDHHKWEEYARKLDMA